MSNSDFHAVSQYASLGAALASQSKPIQDTNTDQSFCGLAALGRYVGAASAHSSPAAKITLELRKATPVAA